MAITKFRPGCTYRHRNAACTTNLYVRKIRFECDRYTKMIVEYHHKTNGRKQYTGRRNDWHSDEVRILATSYQDWTLINPNSEQERFGPPAGEDLSSRLVSEES